METSSRLVTFLPTIATKQPSSPKLIAHPRPIPDVAPVKEIKCYTTRPDTLFGFSFLALSIDHEISKYFLENDAFQKFKKECSKTGTTEEAIAIGEKIGFKTNLTATNPLNPNQKVPVFFANFVLMDYGFGAVFGCPAHDQRDYYCA